MDIKYLIVGAKSQDKFDVTYEPQSFDFTFGSYPILSKESFVLTVKNEKTRIHLEGDTKMTLRIPCDRCMSDTEVPFDIHIDRYIDVVDGVLIESDDEDTTTAFSGFDIDTDRLVSDEILEQWPMKVLCKEDCKGLCTVCGGNLNLKICDCNREVLDPRMAKFQDLLSEIKEV